MKINVAMVSYKNTKPFMFGFNHYGNTSFNLSLLNPASCSDAFANGEVDIALVPVAFLEGRSDYKIITDFCIGADGPVNSVALLSNEPIDKINKLILDNHSMTSNRLVQILLENHWEQEVVYEKGDVSQGITLERETAVVMIGDKVFKYQHQYKHKYDLAEAWKAMTAKPFVFAVWIARSSVSSEMSDQLNEILKFGVNNINTILKNETDPLFDLEEYLTINLQYHLTDRFKSGLNTFLKDYRLPANVH